MRKIVTAKKCLSRKTTPINFDTDTELMIDCINELTETFNTLNKAQGLAATQIGMTKSIALIKFKYRKPFFIINPEIIWEWGSKYSIESCESSNGYYVVQRPLIAKIRWFDTENKMHTHVFTYRKARILYHEIDHLNGINITTKGVYWIGNRMYEKIMGGK